MNPISIETRAFAAVALACALVGPAAAATFQSSVSFTSSLPGGVPIFIDLPQYSGGDTVTSIVLSLTGTAGGVNYYPYYLDSGITVPSAPASWDVLVQGPDYALIADAPIKTEFVGGTISPCDDPACAGVGSDAFFGPMATAFSVSGSAVDLSDFIGTGTAELLVFDSSEYDNNTLSGSLTETITTSAIGSPAPEPATWFLMIAGLGAVGAALRYSRGAVAPSPRPFALGVRLGLGRPLKI
jgi:hypothetical protein